MALDVNVSLPKLSSDKRVYDWASRFVRDTEDRLRRIASQVETVRKNSTGPIFGPRTRFNFIEGSNVTITVADDPIDDEIDITIASSGGGGGGTVTSVAGGVGITNSPEPITVAGTVDLDINSLTSETTLASGDLFPFVDVSVGTSPASQRKVTFANIGSHITLSSLTQITTRLHSDLQGITANDHHNQIHVLADTTGLGPDHTTSGLTAGQVLRATSATTAAFQSLVATDLPAHALLGAQHLNTLAGTPVRGDLIVANATPAWAKFAIGAANRVLRSNGTDPAWAQVALTTDVTGILPIANGGTNASAFTTGSVIFMGASALSEDNTNFFWDNAAKVLRAPALAGGTGIGGNLSLTSTTNATKGKIFLGSPSLSVFDENTNRLGINELSPLVRGHFAANSGGAVSPVIDTVIVAQRDSSAASASSIAVVAGASGIAALHLGTRTTVNDGRVSYDNSTQALSLFNAGAERARLTSTGLRLDKGGVTANANASLHVSASSTNIVDVSIGALNVLRMNQTEALFNNAAALNYALRVNSTATTHLFFVDPSTARVGIKSAATLGVFQIGTSSERILLGDTVTDSSSVVVHGTATGLTVSGVTVDTREVIHDQAATANAMLALRKYTGTAALGARLVFARSRGDATTPGSVGNDDRVAAISAVAWDGTDYEPAAEIQANIRDASPSGTSMGGEWSFLTTTSGTVALTERMRVSQDGVRIQRQGVGGDAAAPLDVRAQTPATLPTLVITPEGLFAGSSAVGSIDIVSGTAGVCTLNFDDTTQGAGSVSYLHASDSMTLATASVVRARLSSAGLRVASTVSADAVERLHIEGNQILTGTLYGGTANADDLDIQSTSAGTSNRGFIKLHDQITVFDQSRSITPGTFFPIIDVLSNQTMTVNAGTGVAALVAQGKIEWSGTPQATGATSLFNSSFEMTNTSGSSPLTFSVAFAFADNGTTRPRAGDTMSNASRTSYIANPTVSNNATGTLTCPAVLGYAMTGQIVGWTVGGSSSVTVTDWIGFKMNPPTTAGTLFGIGITNLYGIYLDSLAFGGATAISLRSNSTAYMQHNGEALFGADAAPTIGLGRVLELERTHTHTTALGEAYAAALTLDPGYSSGGAAKAIAIHNYIEAQNPSATGSSTVTAAAVFRFDAAVGTHKALAAAGATATPAMGNLPTTAAGTFAGWMTVNINGGLGYVPVFI